MNQCPICLSNSFHQIKVLQNRLIDEWKLVASEVSYINRQQGFYCNGCSSNLRSMTLAESIMRNYSFNGSFNQFVNTKHATKLKLLEINEAGEIHTLLMKFKNKVFAEYPTVDIQNLPYQDASFDLIVHSDTLEHVENTSQALKECFRVLKVGGVLFYTIPIIQARLTKRRDLLPDSFHGSQDETQGADFKVWTEYGADFWVEIFNAGFCEVKLNTLEDNSTIAISAYKLRESNRNIIHFPTILKTFSKRIKKRIKKAVK